MDLWWTRCIWSHFRFGGCVSDGDAELVRRCLNGDGQGARALVARFERAVFGLCYRMLNHRQDAEDVAQDVFLRAFRSLSTWDAARPFKPWLLTIAANRCRTVLQQRSRRPIPTDATPEVAVQANAGDRLSLAEELQLGLGQLREEYRTCFILFHQQELAVDEIGRIQGCPVGTVKTWLHRARRELAGHLKRRGFGPETVHELHRI